MALLVTLKPDASCIPDTVSFNLFRAVLDFAVLCVTSLLVMTLRDSLLLRSQNCSAGFRAALSTHAARPGYFLVLRLEKNLHFLFTGDQAKLPGSIIETLINVLCILFCTHNDYVTVSEEQVPGHVVMTFHLAERLWGQQDGK